MPYEKHSGSASRVADEKTSPSQPSTTNRKSSSILRSLQTNWILGNAVWNLNSYHKAIRRETEAQKTLADTESTIESNPWATHDFNLPKVRKEQSLAATKATTARQTAACKAAEWVSRSSSHTGQQDNAKIIKWTKKVIYGRSDDDIKALIESAQSTQANEGA